MDRVCGIGGCYLERREGGRAEQQRRRRAGDGADGVRRAGREAARAPPGRGGGAGDATEDGDRVKG